MSNKRLLLIDDEEDIVDMMRYVLEKEGFEVETAYNGQEGLDKAIAFKPQLILLDRMMPVMDGIETCKRIRNNPEINKCLICFLSARTEDLSQIEGLESGADDYITKPVKPKILISKIKSLLRRANNSNIEKEAEGDVIIDRERYVAVIKGNEVQLPRKEFELLALLVSGKGTVFNREKILSTVWGNDVVVGDRTIDVHIRKLREKIGDGYIKTIKGVGYSFEAEGKKSKS